MASRAELELRANAVGLDPSTWYNDSKLEQQILYLEKNVTAVAGSLAEGTLTLSGALTDGDQVKIGDITYTFVTALSETKASSTLTVSGNFSEGETVSIEGVTYTFRATPANPYDVDLGASAAISLDNLKAAINDSGTEGTTYGTGTNAHPLVTAEANADTTQEVTAKDFGTYANEFQTATTGANAAWDGTSFADGTAGVDAVPFEVVLTGTAATELDNFKAAVNDSGTEGTTYSTGTYAHPQVTATTNTNTTQLVVARDFTVTNAGIATTDPVDDGSVASWGAATLASGTADQNATAEAKRAQVSGDKNMNV